VEGGHKGGLEGAKKSLPIFKRFCEVLLPLLKENIRLQLEGGAEIVMLFDTAAGELSPAVYREHVVPQVAKLAQMYPKRLGYYAKGVQQAHLREPIFTDNKLFAGLGFDHRWDITDSLRDYKVGFVQGNFDQSLLFQAPSEFRIQALKYLEAIKKLPVEARAGWISGLGHGVLPQTPEENVRGLIKLVREVMA
jgi:uroporphyrinogen decarboxylase